MNSSPVIHQLVHTLSYGDAISGEVLAIKRYCDKHQIESEIYAINEHPKLKGKTIDYQDFPQDFSGTVILHYSLGSPLNQLYLRLAQAERWLIYHNLTPAAWFDGVNPRVAADIRQGAKELPGLLAATDQILADSEFNCSQISELGFTATVLELPLDPERWTEQVNPGIAAQIQADNASMQIMHVGRFAPNKCLEDVVRTFYCLTEQLKQPAKLWLVGIDIDTEIYAFKIKRLINHLGLSDLVKMPGCFADSELRALYENADAYLCMSEHEGFCLPVLEAMHFGCPVVAYASSAIPDTVADGGILLRDKDHLQNAAILQELYLNQDLKQQLVSAGHHRVGQLSLQNFHLSLNDLIARESA